MAAEVDWDKPWPAQMEVAEDGSIVFTFRDLPGCMTDGDDITEALENAGDALACYLAHALEAGEPLPEPSHGIGGDYLVIPRYLDPDD